MNRMGDLETGKMVRHRASMRTVLVLAAVCAACAGAIRAGDLLTPEEREWLRQHDGEIRYAPCPNYPPYDFAGPDGRPGGLVDDVMSLLEKNLEFKFKRTVVPTWDELIRRAQNREIDVFTSATPTLERKRHLDFSSPVFEVQTVIVVRAESPRYESVEAMAGRTIAVGKGYIIESLFRAQFPAVKIVEVADDEAGLKAVALGEVDGVLTDLGTATWSIKSLQLNNLRLGSEVLYRIPNCIASRNDWPILARILEKGLGTIPESQWQALREKWIGKLERQPLRSGDIVWYVMPVVGPLILLLLLAVIWSWSLRREVGRRTAQLRAQNEELRRSELALQESQQRLKLAAASAQLGIWDWDIQSDRMTWDDQMFRLYGISERPQSYGIEIWRDGIHPDDRAAAWEACQAALRGEKAYDITFRVRHPDGTVRHIKADGLVLRDGGQKPLRMIGINRDITDERCFAERFRQTEKLEAIGQLAGGVAHDFNNQLTGIMGFADLLHRRLDDPRLKEYAESIMVSSRRAADLTRELLAFARKGKHQIVQVNLHAIISEVAMLLERSIDKRIVIRLNLNAQPHTVGGDPTQLQNALLNLALNARDAMPGGGEIAFETQTVELDERYCRERTSDIAPGPYIRISVSDTGIGIDPQILPRIFEPFFTTKGPGKGTGLGLAAVYGTIKSHHGSIEVQSMVGKGAVFSIHLPLVEQIRPAPAKTGSDLPACGACRILVVDDEETIRRLLDDTLRFMGHKVMLASDGPEAIELYRQSWAEIDLVILDLVMPKVGSLDLFRALRQINPKARVLLASGLSIEGAARQILDEGAIGFMQKPFELDELFKTVADALMEQKRP